MNYYTEVLKKYAVFNGRARRAEYWMFALVNFCIAFALGFIGAIIGDSGVIGLIYTLAVLIPGLAVGTRRLHDTGRSGWWWLIILIPLIGAVVLLIFFIQDSQPGSNAYGPNPKGDNSVTGSFGQAPTDERLQQLEELRTKGLVTDAEYLQKRRDILSQV